MKAEQTDYYIPGADTGPLAAHLITPLELAAIHRLLARDDILPRHRVFLAFLARIPDVVPPLITERQRGRLVGLSWKYPIE